MKRINTILWSNKEPEDKNILWLNKRKLYLWDNGWVAISGSGGSDADLSNYLTKQKADRLYQPKGSYATKSELSSIEEWVDGIDSMLGQYIPIIEQVPFKQEKLISGKNIKTINGYSLLGEGNITVAGGSGNVDIDLSSYLTKDLAAELYQLKGNYASVSALEELQDTAEFLDIELGNVVDNLKTKQDTLTPGQNINIENNVISCTLDTNLYIVVKELPTVGKVNKIYLVEDSESDENNSYTEYIYNNGWEILGKYNTSINLDEYATNEDVSNAINNLKGGELLFNNIKELEECVLEESEKLATLFNEVESSVFTLELTSDSGILSKNIVNKLRNNKLINLLYKNLNYSLTTRSFNNSNSGILIFTSTDISTTYTYYLSINTTDYSYTGTNSIFKVPDEVYIWEQNDKESNTISTQDWTQLANAKQIIIKQGYSHYIPTTISKVAPGGSIKNIICIHDSSPSSSSNITRKWMFSFPALTVQYQESPTSNSSNLSAGEGIKIENNTISCTLDTTLYKVVVNLPDTGEENKIYLVESNTQGEQNIYIEYAYINNAWEILGEYRASVNLEPYALKTEIPKKLSQLENDADYATANEVATAIAQAITTTLNKEV